MVEKRRFVRLDCPIRVRYQLEGKDEIGGEAFSKNIGGMGICFFLSDPFPIGSFLKLILEIPGLPEPVETLAEVVWVDKAERRDEKVRADFEAGLKFTSISSVAKASIINYVYESVKRRKEKV